MGTHLTRADERKLADLEATVDRFRTIYMEAGLALTIIRDEQLYADLAPTFEEYVKKRFDFSKRHANRLILAYEAVTDVRDVVGPTGPKPLPPPATEAVARELAKAESPEKRADLWAAVNSGDTPPLVTAARVAKVRREMFGEPSEDDSESSEDDPEPLWKQFAAKHADALNHLTQAMKAITWIENQGESAAYIQPVITRIKTDYKQLRGTISSNCPVGEKGGKIKTKIMERK